MKKAICMILALLLTASANLRVCARLGAEDTASERFSLWACARAVRAAGAAADELSDEQGAPPGQKLRLTLSLRPPSEDAAALCDALLRQTPGVALGEGCRADGLYLGCTAEGEKLREALRRHIFGTRPPGALSGRFDGTVELAPVYTRPGCERSAEDLCMLVTGLLPVIYTDDEGEIVA